VSKSSIFCAATTRGLDEERLPKAVIGQHLPHLLVIRNLDVTGNVDLVDAKFDRLGNLVVRVV
jgi:hypothetical protein